MPEPLNGAVLPFLQFIPGLTRCRRWYLRIIVNNAKARRLVFRRLDAIDTDLPARTSLIIRQSENRLAIEQEKWRAGYWALLVLMMIPAMRMTSRLNDALVLLIRSSLASAFGIPLPTAPPSSIGADDRAILVLASVVTSVVVCTVLFSPPLRAWRRGQPTLVHAFLASQMSLVIQAPVAGYLALVTSHPLFERIFLLSLDLAIPMVLGIALSVGTAALLVIVPAIAMRRRSSARHADAEVVCALIRLIRYIEARPALWPAVAYRAEIAGRIEAIAQLMENYLPSMLSRKSSPSGQWSCAVVAQAACGVRDLEKWVLWPRNNTRVDLLCRLRQALRLVCEGRWDSLPRSMGRESRRSWWRPSAATARPILVGLIPVALLQMWQLTPLAIGSQAAETAALVAIGWMAVNLVGAIDPQFTAKVASLKEWVPLLLTESSPATDRE